MKNVKVYNKQNELVSDLNHYEDPTEFINHVVSTNYFGKPQRWVRAKEILVNGTIEEPESVLWHSEHYEDVDVLDTEDRDNGSGSLVKYVLLRADYTVEVQDVTEQLNKERRVSELKVLLSESDFRVAPDYFAELPQSEQTKWVSTRSAWRNELRTLLK